MDWALGDMSPWLGCSECCTVTSGEQLGGRVWYMGIT